jgi:hypothetical protein
MHQDLIPNILFFNIIKTQLSMHSNGKMATCKVKYSFKTAQITLTLHIITRYFQLGLLDLQKSAYSSLSSIEITQAF